MNAVTKLGYLLLGGLVLAAQPTWASNVDEAPIGEAVERHLSIDTEYQRWSQHPEEVDAEVSDAIETREVLEDALETVKLSGLVPDIRFEIGRPGFSATKCLVPGVQKLVDMGVADPDSIGLHGHSWSGYQTAFVITQTDIFAAAVAGAPVSNMTSAYSGIRWGTGLARQFQYEKSQSRIGGSLWEKPELYIENSPVFFADRIDTPLLIEFGDEDEAVPWYQGIELYLACRRLGKNCIMLQYRGEPHHLKKYPNKLDYSIKMKEFFDHWLKGEPAPAWMTEGVSYRGE